MKNVLGPCVLMAIVCGLGMLVVLACTNAGFARLSLLYLVNFGIVLILAWVFASSEPERRLAESYVERFQQELSSETRRVVAFALRRP